MSTRGTVVRWRVLLGCATATGFGFAFAARFFGVSLFERMWLPEIGGILVAALVALYASIRNVRKRWPAVVALLGALPLGWRIMELMLHDVAVLKMPWFFQLVIAGGLATLIAAAWSAFRPIPPPPPEDPIPAVRVVD